MHLGLECWQSSSHVSLFVVWNCVDFKLANQVRLQFFVGVVEHQSWNLKHVNWEELQHFVMTSNVDPWVVNWSACRFSRVVELLQGINVILEVFCFIILILQSWDEADCACLFVANALFVEVFNRFDFTKVAFNFWLFDLTVVFEFIKLWFLACLNCNGFEQLLVFESSV